MSSILIDERECVLTITLNRPKTHNALNSEMIHDLKEAFESVTGRSRIRAVHLCAQGTSFCAGADLNYMKSIIEDNTFDNEVDAQKLFDMFEAGRTIPVPVVGELKGNVYGGGLGLVGICDIVLAETKTRFCFSEVKLGLVPAIISPFVSLRMSSLALRELAFTAQVFDTHLAKEIGFVSHIGSMEELEKKREEILNSIVHNGPCAVQNAKRLLNTLDRCDMNYSDLRNYVCKMIVDARTSPEGQEGMRCFFDKDVPEWIRKK